MKPVTHDPIFGLTTIGKPCNQYPPGPHRWWHWRTYNVLHPSASRQMCSHCNELLRVWT